MTNAGRWLLLIILGLILPGLLGCSRAARLLKPGRRCTVACYYFPNWGPEATSEWAELPRATARFAGHEQPRTPAWGPGNEQDPRVMAQKIDAAAGHGIDAFIFDWYYYDSGPYLDRALEQGFLKARNQRQMKFALLWCNHDVTGVGTGKITPETFERMSDDLTRRTFQHPSYWKIDGRPYFSIYQLSTFLQSFGGEEGAAAALDRLRAKARAAGLPGIHLNVVLWDLKTTDTAQTIRRLGIDSLSSYVWIHHVALPDFPANDYTWLMDRYFDAVAHGGGANGLERPAASYGIPYFPNVTMGWDPSPRCPSDQPWVKDKPYPFGAVVTGNTPERFKSALERGKAYAEGAAQTKAGQGTPPVVILNAWNEWGEGSYLEPDTKNGMAYLEAIKSVFD